MTRLVRIYLFLSLLVVFALIPANAFAESYQLPQVLVGNLTVTKDSGQVYYSGMNGNEAVINFDQNYLLGFNQSMLVSPGAAYCWDKITTNPYCYRLDPANSSIRNMVSRTKIGGSTGLEISTLFYPVLSVQGDIYSSADVLNNFQVYGKNLNLNSNRNASWNIRNYTLNSEAQASYAESQRSSYTNRINDLAGEAEVINAPADLAGGLRWHLQADDYSSFYTGGVGGNNTEKYPEGKIWVVNGNVNLGQSITYSGRGTIIINGTLTIQDGVNISPEDSQNPSNSLGIIVNGTGNVRLYSNSKITAAMFALGAIRIQNTTGFTQNVTMNGSYVARDFIVLDSSGRGINIVNIRFAYDYNLSGNWPPGFRYFNMPVASER